MKSILFITALLCLSSIEASAQESVTQRQGVDIIGSGSPFSGPAGGPSVTWHNYRQHRTANDIAPGLALTWDFPIASMSDDLALSLRPGLSYLHPTLLADAALRLQWRNHAAVLAGFSADFTGDKEFRFEESTPEWRWFNEHDSFGKRSFALLGVQIPTGFAYYEFLYRIQLEKGSHAYFTDPENGIQTPAGYRRYFILSVGMGIWL